MRLIIVASCLLSNLVSASAVPRVEAAVSHIDSAVFQESNALHLKEIILPRFDAMIAAADSYNGLGWSGSRVAHSKEQANFCNGTRPRDPKEIWFMQTITGPANLSALTYEALDQWGAGLVTEIPPKEPAIRLITNYNMKSVGCAWSRPCGPDVLSRHHFYLYCSFSPHYEPEIEARDKEYDLRTMVESINYLRGPGTNPVVWNDVLAGLAQIDAQSCTGRLTGDEVLYQNHNGPVDEADTVLLAIADWNSQQFATTADARSGWEVITTPAYREVGCGWTSSCGSNTFLYCKFSTSSTKRAPESVDNMNALADRDATAYNFTSYITDQLSLVRVENSMFPLQWDSYLAEISLESANECSNELPVFYQTGYRFNLTDPNSQATVDTAVKAWANNTNARDRFLVPDLKHVGCSWSTNCTDDTINRSIPGTSTGNWLYCTYSFQNGYFGLRGD